MVKTRQEKKIIYNYKIIIEIIDGNENEKYLEEKFERKHDFNKIRENTTDGLSVQTKNMKSISGNKFSAQTIGMTVNISVLCVDRGE